TRRERTAAPVTLPLVQNPVAKLYPHPFRRPHGDGPLDRRPSSISRPSFGGSDPLSARDSEDTWRNSEICVERIGARCCHRYRLSQAQTRVSKPARYAQTARPVWCSRAGHAARPCPCLDSIL